MRRPVYLSFIFVLISKMIYGYIFLENTLTTASLRQSSSPKPTTLYKRINVERELDEAFSTTLGFIELVNARRKKHKKNSFMRNLDIWCQFQPCKGNCNDTLEKYYYDVQLDQCKPFNYSGCDGNKNSFESLIDCERLCKGVADSSFLEQSSSKTICLLQPNPGQCLALINKYYYDINARTCKKFIYGGCGGNHNRFSSIFSCMQTCGNIES